MDPHANVAEAQALARKLLGSEYEDADTGFHDTQAKVNDSERLAELVIALHEWRTSGGFDPYAAREPGLNNNDITSLQAMIDQKLKKATRQDANRRAAGKLPAGWDTHTAHSRLIKLRAKLESMRPTNDRNGVDEPL